MLKKIFLCLIIANVALFGIFAQDDWGSDDWGDGSSSSESSSGSGNSFWDKFSISGDASLAGRWYFDTDAPVKPIPELELGLDYEGTATKFNAQVNLSERTLLYNKMDILDEFHADVFLGNFVLSAGKMKVVWGKGDKLHVLDNFNANDYTDFLIPDYLDRRAGELMFRVQYNAPSIFRLEGIYAPIMRSEVYAEKGQWVPAKVGKIKDIATQVGGQNVGLALAAKDAAAVANSGNVTAPAYQAAMANYIKVLNETSSMSAEDLYPNTYKAEYGQFGFYGNFSVSVVDFGISYYNGHYKQVTTDLGDYLASVKNNTMAGTPEGAALGLKTTALAMPELHYDKLQVFGFDIQGAAGPFTMRGEFAYNLTKDTDGTDPWTRNNSISYLAGFDVGIPLHNLNLNVQATGNFVLKKDEIEDGSYKLYDADYDPTGKYSNNKLVVQLKDTFNYEKGEVLVKAIYGFERKDLILMPELSYKVRDGWKATLSGMYIHSFGDEEDSEFYGWLDNSFIQLKVNYTF